MDPWVSLETLHEVDRLFLPLADAVDHRENGVVALPSATAQHGIDLGCGEYTLCRLTTEELGLEFSHRLSCGGQGEADLAIAATIACSN